MVGTSIIHSQDENNIGAGFLFWIGEPELTTIKDGWGLLSEEVKTWNGANKTRTKHRGGFSVLDGELMSCDHLSAGMTQPICPGLSKFPDLLLS